MGYVTEPGLIICYYYGILYIFFVITLGLPVFMAEVFIGKKGKSNPVSSIETLAKKSKSSSKWSIVGYGGILASLIIAGYYIGYLSGALTIPIFLQRVGHIRVFAALASLASIAILLHSVFLHPYSWFFIRIITGISLSGIYVIMESWLNDKSTNQTRGQLLGIYMIVTFVFVGLGVGLIVKVLKELTSLYAVRPGFYEFEDVIYLEPVYLYSSFPSGHAATIFSLFLVWISLAFRNTKISNAGLTITLLLIFAIMLSLIHI